MFAPSRSVTASAVAFPGAALPVLERLELWQRAQLGVPAVQRFPRLGLRLAHRLIRDRLGVGVPASLCRSEGSRRTEPAAGTFPAGFVVGQGVGPATSWQTTVRGPESGD